MVAAGGSGGAGSSDGAPGGNESGMYMTSNKLYSISKLTTQTSGGSNGQGENGYVSFYIGGSGGGGGYYGGVAAEIDEDKKYEENEHYILVAHSGSSFIDKNRFINAEYVVGVNEGNGKVKITSFSCPSNCLSCNEYSECDICTNYSLLYNQTCLINCPNGTYPDSPPEGTPGSTPNGRKCLPCNENCSKCAIESMCSICKDPYYNFFGLCLNNCSERNTQSYQYGIDHEANSKRCRRCIVDNCVDCWSDFSRCDRCNDSYTFDKEKNQCVYKQTDDFSVSKIFSQSNYFSKSGYFSYSFGFSVTALFSDSDKFSKSFYFPKSYDFTKSVEFSRSFDFSMLSYDSFSASETQNHESMSENDEESSNKSNDESPNGNKENLSSENFIEPSTDDNEESSNENDENSTSENIIEMSTENNENPSSEKNEESTNENNENSSSENNEESTNENNENSSSENNEESTSENNENSSSENNEKSTSENNENSSSENNEKSSNENDENPPSENNENPSSENNEESTNENNENPPSENNEESTNESNEESSSEINEELATESFFMPAFSRTISKFYITNAFSETSFFSQLKETDNSNDQSKIFISENIIPISASFYFNSQGNGMHVTIKEPHDIVKSGIFIYPSKSTKKKISTGVIAGIISAIITILLIVFLVLLLFILRKRNNRSIKISEKETKEEITNQTIEQTSKYSEMSKEEENDLNFWL